MIRPNLGVVASALALVVGFVLGERLALPVAPAFEATLRALLLAVPPVVFATVAGSIAEAEPEGASLVFLKVGWYLGTAYLAAVVGTGVVALVIGAPSTGASTAALDGLGTIPVSGVLLAVALAMPVGGLARVLPPIRGPILLAADAAEWGISTAGRLSPLLALLGGATLAGVVGSLDVTLRLYALLTGLTLAAAVVWQTAWLTAAVPLAGLDLRSFARYYVAVLPIPFATASEAVSIPPNVASARRHLPLTDDVNVSFDFVLGGALNTPGSVLTGVVFAGAVAHFAFDDTLSVGTLLVVGLVAATVLSASPGVPGELAILLPAVEPVVAAPSSAFAATWLALQIGLPDSIRSTVNVTDDAIYAHFFRRIERRRNRARTALDALEPEY